MDLDTFNDLKKEKQKSYDTVHEPLIQAQVEKFMQSDVEHITGIFGVDVSTLLYLYLNLGPVLDALQVSAVFGRRYYGSAYPCCSKGVPPLRRLSLREIGLFRLPTSGVYFCPKDMRSITDL